MSYVPVDILGQPVSGEALRWDGCGEITVVDGITETSTKRKGHNIGIIPFFQNDASPL